MRFAESSQIWCAMRSPWGEPCDALVAAAPLQLSWLRGAAGRRGGRGPAFTRFHDAFTRCHDRGSVTAEFATVIPAVVLVLGCCLGSVQVVGQHIRLIDAAADAARAMARGDGVERAASLTQQAVNGASFDWEQRGEFVCARLGAPSAFGPFALFGLTADASSCALAGGL